MAWNEDKPADNEKINNLGVVTRANFKALKNAWNGDHTTLSGDGSTTDKHTKVTLPDADLLLVPPPFGPTANTGYVYTKAVSGEIELFYEDELSNVLQLSGNATDLSTPGYVTFPGGFIMQWGETATTFGSAGIEITFPLEFPTAVLIIQLTPSTAWGTNGGGPYVEPTTPAITTTKFTAKNSENNPLKCFWFAVGN